MLLVAGINHLDNTIHTQTVITLNFSKFKNKTFIKKLTVGSNNHNLFCTMQAYESGKSPQTNKAQENELREEDEGGFS